MAETGIDLKENHVRIGANDGVHGKDHIEHCVYFINFFRQAVDDY